MELSWSVVGGKLLILQRFEELAGSAGGIPVIDDTDGHQADEQ
jgi:hypothetical protein